MNLQKIALIGTPNSGKTLFFNRLTGLKQKVANYPGVTLEQKTATYKFNSSLQIIDLPGLYSLAPSSMEAKITTKFLQQKQIDSIFIIAESTDLQKGLFLTMQILQLNIPCCLFLNMEDELTSRGGKIDLKELSKQLGINVYSISALKGWGLKDIFAQLKNSPQNFFTLSQKSSQKKESKKLSPLETMENAKKCSEKVITKKVNSDTLTEKIDGVLLHRFWGSIFFIFFFLIIFQTIFSWSAPLSDLTESSLEWLKSKWSVLLPKEGFLVDLINEGIYSGIVGVVVFLPQIILLFFFIAIMEFSGYMSRASFVADKVVGKFGLQGGSFLPLLSSFACSIPGILSTRTIANQKQRLITIFISPFMPCSARLPVYTLVVLAFVPDKSYILHWRTFAMIFLYLSGAFAGLITAVVLKKIWKIKEDYHQDYIQEIPPYRIPTMRSILIFLWQKVYSFVSKVGKIIIVLSILLWILLSYPQKEVAENGVASSYAGQIGKVIEPVIEPLGFDWRIGIALVSSLAAREIVISTLAIIYQVKEDSAKMLQTFRKEMTPATAISLLIFFMFALQCFSTIAIAKKETMGWKIPIAMFVYMFFLAYFSSLIFYQLVRIF